MRVEMTTLHQLLKHQHPTGLRSDVKYVMALDPGETTGMCLFFVDGSSVELAKASQLSTSMFPQAVEVLFPLLQQLKRSAESAGGKAVLVVEDYHVYQQKLRQHMNSRVHTVRVIGAIEALVALTPSCLEGPVYQTAGQVKKFCTDDRLKEWGLYIEGKKHARDAIRHATYWMVFQGR